MDENNLNIKHDFPQATSTSNAAKGVARRAWDSVFWIWSALMVLAFIASVASCMPEFGGENGKEMGLIIFVCSLFGAFIGKLVHIWGIWLMTGHKEE